MRGKWGIAWLTAVIIMVSLIWAPLPGRASDSWQRGALPFLLAGTQSPMEAQMLGAKPFQARSVKPNPLIPGSPLKADQNGGTTLKLRGNLDMNISVLYNRDEGEPAPALEPQKRSDNSMLMKYSLNYHLLPNLKVGLNAYLYRPDSTDNLAMMRSFGDRVMGMGPGLKYDLGRWSFLVKSQVEAGRDGKDMQNWFRVWYAF